MDCSLPLKLCSLLAVLPALGSVAAMGSFVGVNNNPTWSLSHHNSSVQHALAFVNNLSAGALSLIDVSRDGNCFFGAVGYHYNRGVI